MARGTIFETTTIFHGIEIVEGEVKVTIEEVIISDALVLVPTKEVYIVAQEFSIFIFDTLVRTPKPPYSTQF